MVTDTPAESKCMRKNATKTTPRYALYCRCSSDEQKHKDFSTTDVQEGLSRGYVRATGGTVAGLYKDEAVSGTTLKRKGFQQLLADAQAGKFDVVVVTYMSRLGRGRSFVIAEYELEKCNVRVEMVKEQFTDDIGGYMGKNMTNVMDGMYAFQVRGWTMTKMEEMVEAGFLAGGPAPLGLRSLLPWKQPGSTELAKNRLSAWCLILRLRLSCL